jgi:hypothetical protein
MTLLIPIGSKHVAKNKRRNKKEEVFNALQIYEFVHGSVSVFGKLTPTQAK